MHKITRIYNTLHTRKYTLQVELDKCEVPAAQIRIKAQIAEVGRTITLMEIIEPALKG